jgi:hypothetical protein
MPNVSSTQEAGASFATAPTTEFRIKIQYSLPPLTGLGKLHSDCGQQPQRQLHQITRLVQNEHKSR